MENGGSLSPETFTSAWSARAPNTLAPGAAGRTFPSHPPPGNGSRPWENHRKTIGKP